MSHTRYIPPSLFTTLNIILHTNQKDNHYFVCTDIIQISNINQIYQQNALLHWEIEQTSPPQKKLWIQCTQNLELSTLNTIYCLEPAIQCLSRTSSQPPVPEKILGTKSALVCSNRESDKVSKFRVKCRSK